MTGDKDLDAALARYQASLTGHALDVLTTAAAFGEPDQAAEANSLLNLVDRINRTTDTTPTYFTMRLNQAADQLAAYTTRYATETR